MTPRSLTARPISVLSDFWLMIVGRFAQTETAVLSAICFPIRFRLHTLQKICQGSTTVLNPLTSTDNIPIISSPAKHPKHCFD